MKNAYSLFGTGIVPFKLGRSLSNRNGFYAAETTCPICGARNKDVSQLYRQYLGILYIPVLPLWLASCAECCTRYRLRMKCSELEYLASILNIGANGKYWKPLAISILGFLFGYFMLFFVFTLPPIVCIPVILVASSILNLLRIVEGFAYATAFFGKDGRSVDRRMKALTKLNRERLRPPCVANCPISKNSGITTRS